MEPTVSPWHDNVVYVRQRVQCVIIAKWNQQWMRIWTRTEAWLARGFLSPSSSVAELPAPRARSAGSGGDDSTKVGGDSTKVDGDDSIKVGGARTTKGRHSDNTWVKFPCC